MGSEGTKDRVLDAAWAVAAKQGIEGLTLGGVAERAGVSRQAVYLHFGNRSQLLVEMARRVDRSSGFRARLGEARRLRPLAAFRQVLRAWFEYLPTILPVHRALEAAALVDGDGAEAYRDRMREWRDALAIDVARLAEAGALVKRWDVRTASDWVWSAVHPTTYHHLVDECGWPADRVASTTIDSLERELLDARVRSRRVARSRTEA